MKTFRLYRPGENARVELDKILAIAKTNGKHVNKERVFEFFMRWTHSALDPKQYKNF